MKKNVLPLILAVSLFASCSSAYKTTQTPDDVYYSPGKTREYASVNKNDNYSDGYDNYTSSSEDNYLRMKVQNRYQWDALDDNDYWYSPTYAYNNFYGFNSFNPYLFNSWGLSYYYSPFASLRPYGWFNNYYPSYGFGFGYSPYSAGLYTHGYGYGYYGYTPSTVIVNSPRTRTSRPLLGSYVNNNYNNRNTYRNNGNNRYVPAGTGFNNRYNNSNNNNSFNNNNTFRNNNNNTSTPSFSAPARSYTPAPSSSGGGSVSRPGRH